MNKKNLYTKINAENEYKTKFKLNIIKQSNVISAYWYYISV